MSTEHVPTVAEMRVARATIAPHIVSTSVQPWRSRNLDVRLGADTTVVLKLESFQRTGTFKARAALLNVLGLDEAQRRLGVTAVSAGNHAIAVAYAARCADVPAKVVMVATANPVRVTAAQSYGAEVVFAPDGAAAFALADAIRAKEGRAFIHPFEGRNVVLGTGGVGVELMDAAPDLDAVIVAVGGGGLISGVAAAVKQMNPQCRVFGVEPTGADVMSRSLRAGAPQTMSKVETIADSLAPPMTTQGPFDVCRRFVDEIVTVSDYEICRALALLFQDAKLAVEPAGAAATAALIGPLASSVRGKRVGVVICGANIDAEHFCRYLRRGELGL